MNKVYIFDLRDREAWDWDWALAKCQISDKNVPTQEILYRDHYNDFVFFDGSKAAAIKFYSEYCRKFGLELVAEEEQA